MLKKEQMLAGTLVKVVKMKSDIPLAILAEGGGGYMSLFGVDAAGNRAIVSNQSGDIPQLGDQIEVLSSPKRKGEISGLQIKVKNLRNGFTGYCFWSWFSRACEQVSQLVTVAPATAKVVKPSKTPQGYYVYNRNSFEDTQIVYSNGLRGGGGNCYWRSFKGSIPTQHGKFKNGWSTLLWSCLPTPNSKHNNLSDYTYYPTCPPNFPDWK